MQRNLPHRREVCQTLGQTDGRAQLKTAGMGVRARGSGVTRRRIAGTRDPARRLPACSRHSPCRVQTEICEISLYAATSLLRTCRPNWKPTLAFCMSTITSFSDTFDAPSSNAFASPRAFC